MKKAFSIIEEFRSAGATFRDPVLGIMSLIRKEEDVGKMTLERLGELGREFEKVYEHQLAAALPLDLRVHGLSAKERLEGLSPDELNELRLFIKQKDNSKE